MVNQLSSAPVPAARPRFAWPAGLVAVVALAFAVVVLVAATGPRGTDQFWYLAAVENLAEGRGAITNNVFPASLKNGPYEGPRPLVHNILNVYLPVPLATWLGSYGAWIWTNLLASLATAVLVFLATRRLASLTTAWLAAATYLMLPVVLWQAAQPLAEATIAPFVALAFLLVLRASGSFASWLAVAVSVGLLVLCRATFLPLLVAAPLGYLATQRGVAWRRLAGAAGLGLVGAAFLGFGRVFLPQNVPCTIAQFLGAAIPGRTSNMACYFELEPIPIDLGVLLTKLGHAARAQFVPSRGSLGTSLLFYWPFNVMGLLSLALITRRHEAGPRRALVAALTALALVGATTVIFQSQFRYLLMGLPVLAVTALVALERLAPAWVVRRFPLVLGGLLAVALPINVALAMQSRNESLGARRFDTEFTALVQREVPAGERVTVEWGARAIEMGYLLRPRPVLFVAPEYERGECVPMVSGFGARWLVAAPDSRALACLSPLGPRPVAEVTAGSSRFGLFRLNGAVAGLPVEDQALQADVAERDDAHQHDRLGDHLR